MEYKPTTRVKEILDFAQGIINSLPYKISLRFLFYALKQQGYYASKKEYRNFKERCIEARRNFYDKWRPWTLEDEGRSRITRAWGEENIKDCLLDLPYEAAQNINLDHFYKQNKYVEIWFESRGSTPQFRHYTQNINLVPFGGDPSLPLLWDTAKWLEKAAEKYGKNVLILYFGDCDKYGERIMTSAVRTVRQWCEIDFKIEWCGLTLEQAEKHNLPENFEKPGTFEWESFGAMKEEGARIAGEIIADSLSKFIDIELIKKTREEIEQQQKHWEGVIRVAIEENI